MFMLAMLLNQLYESWLIPEKQALLLLHTSLNIMHLFRVLDLQDQTL